MKTIFDPCIPRDEVLRGELKEDIFAARLKDVMDGTADPVYGDPQTFFENTYPTSGLKSFLKDAVGRLVGDATGTNAIIRLETAFGGGKTHNLIALYHVVRGATAGALAFPGRGNAILTIGSSSREEWTAKGFDEPLWLNSPFLN